MDLTNSKEHAKELEKRQKAIQLEVKHLAAA
jgi:hypothetical protein